MSTVTTIALVMLTMAGALTLLRILRGPATLDRIAALDVLVVLIVAATATQLAGHGLWWYLPVIAAVSLLGFVGSVTAVRLAPRREQHR